MLISMTISDVWLGPHTHTVQVGSSQGKMEARSMFVVKTADYLAELHRVDHHNTETAHYRLDKLLDWSWPKWLPRLKTNS